MPQGTLFASFQRWKPTKNKREKRQYDEAAELVREYRTEYGRDPGARELHEFFWLFCNDPEQLEEPWERVMKLVGNESMSNECLCRHKPMFDSMEEFLASVQ